MQAVVGQMLTFFGEIGCQFPQFPFIAHSRGWSAEDMERNQQMRARIDSHCTTAPPRSCGAASRWRA